MARIDDRGWFVGGGYRIDRGGFDNPPRMGVRWSPAEDYDLWLYLGVGTRFDVLCSEHGRSPGSISQRLCEYEYGITRCALGVLVFLYVCRNDKPHFKRMRDKTGRVNWVLCSRDGKLAGAYSKHLWELVAFWKRHCATVTKGWDYRKVR